MDSESFLEHLTRSSFAYCQAISRGKVDLFLKVMLIAIFIRNSCALRHIIAAMRKYCKQILVTIVLWIQYSEYQVHRMNVLILVQ